MPHVLQGEAQLTLPGCGAVNLNVGQVGYFRSSYAAPMQDAHVAAFASYPAIEQLGLLQAADLGRDGLVRLTGPLGKLVDRPPAGRVGQHEREQLALELRPEDREKWRGGGSHDPRIALSSSNINRKWSDQ